LSNLESKLWRTKTRQFKTHRRFFDSVLFGVRRLDAFGVRRLDAALVCCDLSQLRRYEFLFPCGDRLPRVAASSRRRPKRRQAGALQRSVEQAHSKEASSRRTPKEIPFHLDFPLPPLLK
jgi:hypothetical protein